MRKDGCSSGSVLLCWGEDEMGRKEQGVIQDDIQNEYFQIVSKSKTFRLFCFQVSGSLSLSFPAYCLRLRIHYSIFSIEFILANLILAKPYFFACERFIVISICSSLKNRRRKICVHTPTKMKRIDIRASH